VTADVKPHTRCRRRKKKNSRLRFSSVTWDNCVNAGRHSLCFSLLGGLIVKVGSRHVDTSLRTKLSTLSNTLKELADMTLAAAKFPQFSKYQSKIRQGKPKFPKLVSSSVA